MKINQVEKLIGLPKHTIMYYEKEGLVNPRRDENGYRHFDKVDIQTLQFIMQLRDMQLTIDEIKEIMNGELSIREAINAKEEFLTRKIDELEASKKLIESHKRRQKVNIAFDDEILINKLYERLYLNETEMKIVDTFLPLDEIKNIDISMCSHVIIGGYMMFVNMEYFPDIDIVTSLDTYSFQIMNEEKLKTFFDYLKKHHIPYTDILHLEDIYNQYIDKVRRNKYINSRFKKWAKQYHLDNPRESPIQYLTSNYTDSVPVRFKYKK